MVVLYVYIFQKGFQVLNAILQAFVYVTILPPLCITIFTTVSKFVNILLVVELLYHLAEKSFRPYRDTGVLTFKS